MGGIQALTRIAIAAIIPARQRGKYIGYIAATQAVATIGGPLFRGADRRLSAGVAMDLLHRCAVRRLTLIVLQIILQLPDEHRQVRSTISDRRWEAAP